MAQIILASSSPRRRQLLKKLNIEFLVEGSQVKEVVNNNDSPEQIVQKLASDKALDIAGKNRDSLVIGADTIVVFDDKILEKPGNREHAFKMLKQLSDNTHHVYTGVAIVKNDKAGNIKSKITFSECTEVTFGRLETYEIRSYIDSGGPMDKAGAYGIQDNWGAVFVKKIDGDYYNVMGLPLHHLYHELKNVAPEYLAYKP